MARHSGTVAARNSGHEALRDRRVLKPARSGSDGSRWEHMNHERAPEQSPEESVAVAAVAEAELAARAVIETQAAVTAAARTVAETAAAAVQAVAAAVDANAAVASAAAASAAEARRTEARLTHEILHDDLTGLVNRRLLVDRLTQALARASRAGTTVAVLFLDLDYFKAVNDTFGHAIGDELLIGVARRLQESLRDTDTCARVGGDEFVVVCEDLSHASDGALVAGRLEDALAAGVPVGNRNMPVRASIGIAVSSAGSLPQELLNEADAAMYRAKGGDRTRSEDDPSDRFLTAGRARPGADPYARRRSDAS